VKTFEVINPINIVV